MSHQAVILPKIINIPRFHCWTKSHGIPLNSKYCFGSKSSWCSLEAPGCTPHSVTQQSWRWRRRRAGKDSAKHPNTAGIQEKQPRKPPLPHFCLCSWDLPALVTLLLNGRMILSLSFPGESHVYSPPWEEEPGAGCFTHWHLWHSEDRSFLEPCQLLSEIFIYFLKWGVWRRGFPSVQQGQTTPPHGFPPPSGSPGADVIPLEIQLHKTESKLPFGCRYKPCHQHLPATHLCHPSRRAHRAGTGTGKSSHQHGLLHLPGKTLPCKPSPSLSSPFAL